MRCNVEDDLTQTSLNWMNMMAEKASGQAMPPAGLQVILGEDMKIKLKNVMKAMNENKFRIMQAIFQKI